MQDIIIIGILLCIVITILVYLYKAKKRGGSCIGCPCAKQCGGKSGCCQGTEGGSDWRESVYDGAAKAGASAGQREAEPGNPSHDK